MAATGITDPLGRRIILDDRTWYGHVIKGHPEVADARALVEKTVEVPDEIHYSRCDPDCRLYYGPGPRSGVMIQVVGDVAVGIVKTAHVARKTTGGAVEWSSQKP